MENNKIVFPELFFTDKNLVGRDVLKSPGIYLT